MNFCSTREQQWRRDVIKRQCCHVALCATADCCRGAELKATHLTTQLLIQIEVGLDLAQVCFLSQQGLESLHSEAGTSLQPLQGVLKGAGQLDECWPCSAKLG